MNELVSHICMWSCIVSLVACAGDAGDASEKGKAPTPNLVGGKADGDSVVVRGQLGYGDEAALSHAIPSPLRFDAYEIDIEAGGLASFEITQKGTSRGFDSLLYVYGPRDAAGSYADTPVARDDDSGWGRLSRITEVQAGESGTYLLVVGSYQGNGSYRIKATCDNGACEAPPLTGDCVFGSSYGELLRGTPATTITEQTHLTDPSELDEVRRSQLIDSLTYAGFDDVLTVEQAFATVDEGRVNRLAVWDVSNEAGFDVLEYGLGDTSVGTIYAAGTTQRVAVIADLDIYDCEVFQGPGRRDCGSSDDCADGLTCEGRVDGLGSCVNAVSLPDGAYEDCGNGADCGAGLVCAGENFGGGQCNPAWMRRRFQGATGAAIVDGTAAVPLVTYGLATVHTDVTLDLFISHADASTLRVVLVNPTGTESVVHNQSGSAGGVFLNRLAVPGFPGDEDANGTWTLQVESTNPALTGAIVEFGLEVTSRWD